MTPPSAKPEASVSDATVTETTADQTADATEPALTPGAPVAEAARAAPGTRRRAASLELRVARKRTGPEGEEAEAAPLGGRRVRSEGPGRAVAGAGPRLGLRAQARSAKAAGTEGVEPPAFAAPPVETALPDAHSDQVEMFDLEAVDASQPDTAAQIPQAAQSAQSAQAAELPPPPLRPAVALTPAPQPPAVVEEVLDDEDDEDDRGPGQGGRRRGARAEKRNSRTATKNDAAHYVVAPTVNPAVMRVRHYGVIASFLLFVLVPTISYSVYLWTRSADQYESDVGFGSRTEEAASTFDFLGALGGTTQSGSKDMDILNQFIISQELVAKIDAELDLKAMYSRAADDPLNAFVKDGTIEDLVEYWQRMVLVNYDNGTGLMNLRVFAFDPVDAQKIARAVLTESTQIINDLSQTAQEDTTRYSKDALAATEKKLAEARLAVLDFQVRNRIVDPSNVIANQLSVVSTLNQQLAAAQIDLDMLTGTVPDTDPRIAQITRRIEVIRNRIAEEQSKVGANADSNSPGFAKLTADFEGLKVAQDFAQQAYLSALAAHDQALTDAQHKTRYLATYVEPTLAEASTAPSRPVSAGLTALIGLLSWAVTVLIYYALRDRR